MSSISMPLLTFIQPSMLTEEQIYLEEWTNSSRLLFYSVLSIAFFTLPVLLTSFCWIRCKKRQNVHFLPYLCAILGANMVLLGTLMTSVITENTDYVYDIIPGYLVCKLTAFLVNSSSCFIHWAWVAMYAEWSTVVRTASSLYVSPPSESCSSASATYSSLSAFEITVPAGLGASY
ncbi:hypothetical protein GCK72_021638 [Caenorhabditis remanei]|uniref:Uncharacterized protein n=1 Tax=Caenorhabditis remanei TaxID=31234 RepID=A0A6A5GIP8_CAERE|nr:hypothetical protein GCK72_021638 [Caenorhabditis remanei]KAF1755070.1 hypothetical protein GCK72_021638 [Caenorhabditis remanei]